MKLININVLKLQSNAQIPLYQTSGGSGMDLCSVETLEILPRQIMLVPTGIALEIPKGFEGQVRPRSGLALKGITVVNTPGTIDSDYRGEVKVILTNLSDKPFIVEEGMRIAQLVIAEVVGADMIEVNSLDATVRGNGGFGSTGLK